MFIYAADLPKDMEKPLLQVMTVEPQHIIHFLSFNLVVSLGKFFWSPHPAVKHGHYSIMWELYLKQFRGFKETTQEEMRITIILKYFWSILDV